MYFACIYHVLFVLKWMFTYIWRYVWMYGGSFDAGLRIYFMMEITFHQLVLDIMSDSCRTFFLSFEDLPGENGYDIVLIFREPLPTKCPDICFESAFCQFSLIISVYPKSSWTAEGHWTIGYTPRYVQCIMLIFGDNYIPYGNHFFEQHANVGVFFLFFPHSPSLSGEKSCTVFTNDCSAGTCLHASLSTTPSQSFGAFGTRPWTNLCWGPVWKGSVWMGHHEVLARLLDLTFDPSLVDIQMVVAGTSLIMYVFLEGLWWYYSI